MNTRIFSEIAGQLVAGLVAMVASMPLMGGAEGHAAHGGDPLTAWTMRVLGTPP